MFGILVLELWLAITNLDPNQPAEIEASLSGITDRAATGEVLTAVKVDSVSTFDAPNAVAPKPVSAKVQGGRLARKLEPKSVTVISIEQSPDRNRSSKNLLQNTLQGLNEE